MEELRAQHIYIALVSSSSVVASSSYIGADEKRPESSAGIKQGHGWCPIASVAVRVCVSVKWFPFGGERNHIVRPLQYSPDITSDDRPLEYNLDITSDEAQEVQTCYELKVMCPYVLRV